MQITEDLLLPKNNYCVYLHKRADDGTVFYIGSGVQNKREKHFNDRSKTWHKIKDTFGVIVEIFKSNLDKNSARSLEEELINSRKYPDIINTRKVLKSYSPLLKSEFEEFVYYDETSPTCLRWKKITGPRVKVDDPVGSNIFTKDGIARSITAKINGRNTTVSRIIWALFNEEVPEDMVIDHIDNNPHNNKILNLRCVSIADNSRNRQRNREANSEFVCVYKRSTDYYVSVCLNGNTLATSFAFSKYGEELALQKAISWRKAMIDKVNSHGANYTDNHTPNVNCDVDYSNVPVGYFKTNNVWCRKDSSGKITGAVAVVVFNGRKREKLFSIKEHGEASALALAKEFLQKNNYCEDDFDRINAVKIKVTFIDTEEEIGTYKSVVQAAKETGLSLGTFYKRLDGEVKGNAKYQGREIKIIRLSPEQIRRSSQTSGTCFYAQL